MSDDPNEQRAERERRARKEAEALLESKSRELYRANQELARLNESLERRVEERTHELIEAREAALTAARVKAEFLANMSHEIRTPMHGILGMTELLIGTTLLDDQREYAELIRASGESLLCLINDILDFSKIEAGKLTLETIPFPIEETLAATLKTSAMRAAQKGVTLACRFAPDLPDLVLGDPGRLRQVVQNLVGNAVKFTDRGEIAVTIAIVERSETDVRLSFEVVDTGIGIPPEKQRTIFDAFSQADGSITRKYGGTGLGLSISSQLVAMMGGRLEVASRPGEGSRFSCELRFSTKSDRRSRNFVRAEELAGRRALIVEAHAPSAAILADTLGAWGIAVEVVDRVQVARTRLESERLAGRPFHFALVDVDGSSRDGSDLIDPKAIPANAARLILISSIGRRAERSDDRGGVDRAYLSKPALPRELFKALIGAPAKAGFAAPAKLPSQPVAQNLGGIRVLLAEDNLVNQLIAVRMLERHGYSVHPVVNGREALDALAREEFDLVLMDGSMPELDGMTATRMIRERERATGAHVPIIALTAHAMKGDRERFLESGMDAYITKPIQIAELLTTIARVINTRSEEADVA